MCALPFDVSPAAQPNFCLVHQQSQGLQMYGCLCKAWPPYKRSSCHHILWLSGCGLHNTTGIRVCVVVSVNLNVLVMCHYECEFECVDLCVIVSVHVSLLAYLRLG